MPNMDPVEFDDNLDIPNGLKYAYHVDDIDDPDVIFGVDEFGDDDEDDDATDEDIIDAPTTLTIVSQVVRTASDGSQVVDVTIEVEDIPNVVKYDVRTTKV